MKNQHEAEWDAWLRAKYGMGSDEMLTATTPLWPPEEEEEKNARRGRPPKYVWEGASLTKAFGCFIAQRMRDYMSRTGCDLEETVKWAKSRYHDRLTKHESQKR